MRVRYAVARMRDVVRASRARAPLHVVGKGAALNVVWSTLRRILRGRA